MTLAELETALAGRRIARSAGVCLFTTRDASEAAEWERLGARTRHGTYGGGQCWEVMPAYCLPEQNEQNDDGEHVDTRPAFLLAYLRERDGYSKPVPSWMPHG